MEKGPKPKKVKPANPGSAIAIAQEKLTEAGSTPNIKLAISTGADTSVKNLSSDIQKTGQPSKTLTLNNASALKQTSTSDPNISKVLQPTSAHSTGAPKKQLGTISGSSSTNGNAPKKTLGTNSGSSSSNTKPKKTKKKTKPQGTLTEDQQKRKNEGIRKTKERVAKTEADKQKAANNAAVKQQTEIAIIKASTPTVEKSTAIVPASIEKIISNTTQKSGVVSLIKNSQTPQTTSVEKLPEDVTTPKTVSNTQKEINAIKKEMNNTNFLNVGKLATLTGKLANQEAILAKTQSEAVVEKPRQIKNINNVDRSMKLQLNTAYKRSNLRAKQEAIANPKTKDSVENPESSESKKLSTNQSAQSGQPEKLSTNQSFETGQPEKLPDQSQGLPDKRQIRANKIQIIANEKAKKLSDQNEKIRNLVKKANNESRAPQQRSLFGKFLNKIGVGAMFHSSRQQQIARAMSKRERLGKEFNKKTKTISEEEKKEIEKEKKKNKEATALAERIVEKKLVANKVAETAGEEAPKQIFSETTKNSTGDGNGLQKTVINEKIESNTGNTKTKKNNSGTTKNNSTPTKLSLGTNANIAERQKRTEEYQKQLGRTSNKQSFLNTQKEVGKLLDFKPKTPETPSNNVSPAFKKMFGNKGIVVNSNNSKNSAYMNVAKTRAKNTGYMTADNISKPKDAGYMTAENMSKPKKPDYLSIGDPKDAGYIYSGKKTDAPEYAVALGSTDQEKYNTPPPIKSESVTKNAAPVTENATPKSEPDTITKPTNKKNSFIKKLTTSGKKIFKKNKNYGLLTKTGASALLIPGAALAGTGYTAYKAAETGSKFAKTAGTAGATAVVGAFQGAHALAAGTGLAARHAYRKLIGKSTEGSLKNKLKRSASQKFNLTKKLAKNTKRRTGKSLGLLAETGIAAGLTGVGVLGAVVGTTVGAAKIATSPVRKVYRNIKTKAKPENATPNSEPATPKPEPAAPNSEPVTP